MKTTVDIPDPIMRRLRERAARDKTSLKSLIQAALVKFLSPKRSAPYKLRDASFKGTGLAPGIEEGEWAQVRSIIYEGRGG